MKIKLALGCAITGLCAVASGQTLLSTLNSTVTDNWWDDAVGGTDPIAQVFTTGSQSESIGSVSAGLFFLADGTMQAGIYNNGVGGQPGSLAGNGLLAGPATQIPYTLNTFTANDLTLAADTTYWLIFSDSSAGGTGLTATSDASGVSTSGVAGWTLGDTFVIPNGASEYSDEGQGFTTLFSIDGTDVPEPSTLALSAAGGLAALLKFRRRRS